MRLGKIETIQNALQRNIIKYIDFKMLNSALQRGRDHEKIVHKNSATVATHNNGVS